MLEKNLKIVGLIPAKENSKGLKNKNIKKLNNLSLVEIAILSSKKSKIIEHTFISSDSDKILNIGKKYKINIIKRKKKFCKFSSTANEVITDFIGSLKKTYKNSNFLIVYLQPTSPFRNHKHIDLALKKFFKFNYRTMLSVTENKNFFKSFKNNKDKINPFFSSKHITKNRQNFKEIYSPNGAIYIFFEKDFKKRNKLNFENSGFFLMNKVESIDIDEEEDYEFAKIISKKFVKYKKWFLKLEIEEIINQRIH